jgi:hypothetical protein
MGMSWPALLSPMVRVCVRGSRLVHGVRANSPGRAPVKRFVRWQARRIGGSVRHFLSAHRWVEVWPQLDPVRVTPDHPIWRRPYRQAIRCVAVQPGRGAVRGTRASGVSIELVVEDGTNRAVGECADLDGAHGACFHTRDAERSRQAQDAEAGSEALLGMRPALRGSTPALKLIGRR